MSKHSVSGLISQNTGVAPLNITELAEAINVISGTITSSPGPISRAFKAQNNAAVPLVIAIACLDPVRSFVISSNSFCSS